MEKRTVYLDDPGLAAPPRPRGRPRMCHETEQTLLPGLVVEYIAPSVFAGRMGALIGRIGGRLDLWAVHVDGDARPIASLASHFRPVHADAGQDDTQDATAARDRKRSA